MTGADETGARIIRDGKRTTSPVVALALRPHRRADGSTLLVGVLHEAVELAAGTEVHMQRIAGDDRGDRFALRLLPPTVAPSRRALKQAAADDLTASAIRQDARDAVVHRDPSASADTSRTP